MEEEFLPVKDYVVLNILQEKHVRIHFQSRNQMVLVDLKKKKKREKQIK